MSDEKERGVIFTPKVEDDKPVKETIDLTEELKKIIPKLKLAELKDKAKSYPKAETKDLVTRKDFINYLLSK
jgi:hypothetical protein